MNEEEEFVRESILTAGIILVGIDILIINGLYESEINIFYFLGHDVIKE